MQISCMWPDVGCAGVLASSPCLAESYLVFEHMEKMKKSANTLLLLFEFPYFSQRKDPPHSENLRHPVQISKPSSRPAQHVLSWHWGPSPRQLPIPITTRTS